MRPYEMRRVSVTTPSVVQLLLCIYGVALGLPMLAVSLLGAVTVRLDDLIVCLLLLAVAVTFVQRRPISAIQVKAVEIWIVFAVYCLLSAWIFFQESHREHVIYTGFRMVGCLSLYVVVVVLVRDLLTLEWLLIGLAGGTLCWLGQVAAAIVLGQDTTFQHMYEWKALFATGGMDPNYIASYSIMGAYAIATLATLVPRVGIPCVVGAACATFVPVMMLSRGVTIAVMAGWITYLVAAKRVSLRSTLLLAAVFAGVFFSIKQFQGGTGEGAWAFNLRTGEGLAGRMELWRVGLDIIAAAPLLGHGFGSETTEYLNAFPIIKLSHIALLSVWIELGVFGVFLFVAALLRPLSPYFRGEASPMRSLPCEIRALGLAVFAAEMVYGFCYWNKVPMLCFALLAVLGGVLQAGSGSTGTVWPEVVDGVVEEGGVPSLRLR